MNKIVFCNLIISCLFSPLITAYYIQSLHLFKFSLIIFFLPFFLLIVNCGDSEDVWAIENGVHLRKCLLNSQGWHILLQHFSCFPVFWDLTQHSTWLGSTKGLIIFFPFLFLLQSLWNIWDLCLSPIAQYFCDTWQRMCLKSSRVW